MSSRFYKMTGSGNDFVFLDGREHDLAAWPAARIAAMCDRRQGVGADGLIHVSVNPDGAIRMVYFNSDGSHADMCGNGALCTTRLAAHLGLARPDRVELATDAGRLDSRCVGPGWGAEIRFPTAPVPEPLSVPLGAGEQRALQGTVGVPHTVILVTDIDRVDVPGRGRQLRFHPAVGPAGSNINFVGRIAGDDAAWAIRTYERGVEGETLACGTGTIAAGLALAGIGLADLPVRIRCQGGSVYGVAGTLNGPSADDVWLRGEGRLVFTGSLEGLAD